MEEHHINVPRTARYHTLGDAASAKAIWFVLHGYGHLARYFLRQFEGLEDDVLIVAPEGLSRFYLDEEHARVGATWMTREDRDHEMIDQITYLDKLAASVIGNSSKNIPVRALGFSQGVATACRWAMNGNTRMDRLVLWGGSMPPELERDALAARWAHLRVDVVHGERDELVNETVFRTTEAKLRGAGVQHTSHRFSGGHELERILLERLMKA